MSTDNIDMAAAWIRKGKESAEDTFNQLFFQLESQNLPHIRAEYTVKGLFKRTKTPSHIEIDHENLRYIATYQHNGISCVRQTIVHGIKIGETRLPFSEWIAEITQHLSNQGNMGKIFAMSSH